MREPLSAESGGTAAWRWLAGAALLACAGLVCYGGPTLLDLGFYHDDWFSLTHIHFAPDTFPHRVTALAQGDVSQLFRPFDLILWPLLYSLFGLDPLPWQVLLLCVNVGIGLACAALLMRFKVPLGLALVGGLLLLSYPSKDANLFWPLNIINPLSFLFYLLGHLAFLRFTDSGSRRSLLACGATLLLSVTTYDQTAFLPLCWLITPRLFEDGIAPRVRNATLAAMALVAAFLCYKLLFVPHFFGVPFRKALLLSPWHFIKTYLAGLNAQFGPRLILTVLFSAVKAAASSPLVCLAGLAIPWLCLAAGGKDEAKPRTAPAESLVLLGAAVFFLGYLPIALSDYTPTPLNHQNRINLAPSLGIILTGLGCAAGRVPAGRGPAVLALLASVFLTAHVWSAGVWAESYRLQCEVMELVQRRLPEWPADKTLLVRLPERYVEDKAPVFDAYWDVTGAIRLATGDVRRRAVTVSPRMRFEADRAVEPGMPDIPYKDALILDTARGTLEPANPGALTGLPHPR
ncbi:MAG: hypothetical protein HY924_10805 [Elusimicrobia bacterium]|nr:hypothetical protein [Elusimicrobiota bacterium]